MRQGVILSDDDVRAGQQGMGQQFLRQGLENGGGFPLGLGKDAVIGAPIPVGVPIPS